MTSLQTPDAPVNAEAPPPPPALWRQQIMLSGRSLATLERESNYVRSSYGVNVVIISGAGPYFPHLIGPDWAAGCVENCAGDAQLDDMTPLVDWLLSRTMFVEAPEGIEALYAWRDDRDDAA